jgi:NADPH:quinone reductase-like Zn-dependent oxidoreductase
MWVNLKVRARSILIEGVTRFVAGTPKGLELAKREGAHHAFDHRKPGYQEEILQTTGNRGADIILEMLANVNPSSRI